MSHQPDRGRELWRVGHHADPVGFAPRELYEFGHRFDDVHGRFRTLYCAELPETCLREVLADFRPNLAALRRHVERYGPGAREDFASEPVTTQWRTQHVLAPVRLVLHGPLVDLTDIPVRQEIEDRHRELLLAHGLRHLDLHEITTSRRAVTQTIAADLFDCGAAAVRVWMATHAWSSSKSRGVAVLNGEMIALTDPPPQALTNVATPWRLRLAPAPVRVCD